MCSLVHAKIRTITTACHHRTPMSLTLPDITTVILAGGAGRRMGGADKGLLLLDEITLIGHVLKRLKPQTERIVINCNRSLQEYARLGYPLVEDSMAGGLGPLAGVLSALEHSDSDYVLSVPCDTPRLPPDLIERMARTMLKAGVDACTVSDGERLHPVILLVHRRALPSLRAYLEAGNRKVHDWFFSISHCEADFSDQAGAFININTPDQLAELEQDLNNAD